MAKGQHNPVPAAWSPLRRELEKVLGDRQPHTFGEIMARVGHLITPERAYRTAGRDPRAMQRHAEGWLTLEDRLDIGRRRVVRDSLRSTGVKKIDEGRKGNVGRWILYRPTLTSSEKE